MTWVVDQNFNNTLTVSQATLPFDSTPGKRMLGLGGAGAAYRDDIDKADIEISCGMFINTNKTTLGQSILPSGFLIARRQPDGSFYAGTWSMETGAFTFDDIGSGTSLVNNISAGVCHYDGPTNSFTTLSEELLFEVNPRAVDFFDLLNVSFRIKSRVLSLTITDALNVTKILEVGYSDNTITASGNPGVGANIDPGANAGIIRSIIYINNVKINEI